MRPRVFVSSTFFDLGEVRDQMRQFIDSLGYEPLLSEHHTFPVDPSVDAIENCRRLVERDADILLLIVGTRYGSRLPESTRSVTNMEYLAARETYPHLRADSPAAGAISQHRCRRPPRRIISGSVAAIPRHDTVVSRASSFDSDSIVRAA